MSSAANRIHLRPVDTNAVIPDLQFRPGDELIEDLDIQPGDQLVIVPTDDIFVELAIKMTGQDGIELLITTQHDEFASALLCPSTRFVIMPPDPTDRSMSLLAWTSDDGALYVDWGWNRSNEWCRTHRLIGRVAAVLRRL